MTALNAQWHAARQLRQHDVANRRIEVSTELGHWQSARLTEAEGRCQHRFQTVAELRAETTLWLAQITHQREAQILPLRQSLQRYRQQLQAETQLMREARQADCHDLQVEVQAALGQLATVRRQAALLNQAQRQEDRQALTALVDDMFEQLAAFRQELQAERAALTTLVWGAEPTPAMGSSAQPAPQPVAITRPALAQVKAPAASGPVATKSAPAKSAPVAKAPARPAPMAVPVAPLVPQPVASPAPVATVTTPPSASPRVTSLEELVYNYLHLAQGARLTEIETELGINRFQAVDALRSLIQKDLIVKTDRTYHVQEEAVL
ncbi:MAG: hypothetical protein ACFCVD_06825 [Nodosilinea sp.]